MEPGEMDAVEARLSRGQFLECRPVWYSSNSVYLGRLDCGDASLLVIYKPRSGETPLWDFPEGTLFRREAAAYRLARLLAWPLVPPTVIREGPAGIGSVQLFIRHDPEKHYFVQREDPSLWPQLQRLCLFDAIANNADRKGGHCLLDASGHVWAIDNGLCFNEQYKLRSVIWDWAGEPIPGELLAELEAGLERLRGDSAESAALRGLLSAREFEQTIRRAEQLVRAGVFPLPGPTRHYPWPLV
jgi:uncharacterized repeat protein (TIGR03843 family)